MAAVMFKYAMIDGIHPVLFFEGMEHKRMEALGPVAAAAFVVLDIDTDQDPRTCGESVSLGMKPEITDAEMIKHFISRGRVV